MLLACFDLEVDVTRRRSSFTYVSCLNVNDGITDEKWLQTEGLYSSKEMKCFQ